MALMNKNTGANRKQDILQNRTACTKALWQKQGLGVQAPFTGIKCSGPFHSDQVFRGPFTDQHGCSGRHTHFWGVC